METPMIQEETQRVADLAEQLSEALMTAAICANEIRAILGAELDGRNPAGWGRSRPPSVNPRHAFYSGLSTYTHRWSSAAEGGWAIDPMAVMT